jgi:hypothetical protein
MEDLLSQETTSPPQGRAVMSEIELENKSVKQEMNESPL